jgi:hypothetical protein
MREEKKTMLWPLGEEVERLRTQKLSPERRREIAQNAAFARWGKTKTRKRNNPIQSQPH